MDKGNSSSPFVKFANREHEMDMVLQYLSSEDHKALRQTCQSANAAVLKSWAYYKKGRFKIDLCSENEEQFFKQPSKYTAIHIDDFYLCNVGMRDGHLNQFLTDKATKVLDTSTNLRSLSISVPVFNSINLGNPSGKLWTLIKQLKELRIVVSTNDRMQMVDCPVELQDCNSPFSWHSYMTCKRWRIKYFEKNILQLASKFLKLTSLQVTFPYEDDGTSSISDLTLLIKSIQSTVECLRIDTQRASFRGEFDQFRCPNLKNLHIESMEPSFLRFALQQSSLEVLNLTLRWIPFGQLITMPQQLVNLNTFSIVLHHVDQPANLQGEQFRFLRELDNLENVSIQLTHQFERLKGWEILRGLPAGKIKSLQLNNINSIFRVTNEHLLHEDRWRLKLFTNLTTLNLLHSEDALNDLALHEVIRTCVGLKHFYFGPSKFITVYGLTGKLTLYYSDREITLGLDEILAGCDLRQPVTRYNQKIIHPKAAELYDLEVNIGDLKNLESLGILDCENLSKVGTVRAVKFARLKRLFLKSPNGFDRSDLLCLAVNNPRLQTLDVNSECSFEAKLVMEKVAKLANSNLRKIYIRDSPPNNRRDPRMHCYRATQNFVVSDYGKLVEDMNIDEDYVSSDSDAEFYPEESSDSDD